MMLKQEFVRASKESKGEGLRRRQRGTLSAVINMEGGNDRPQARLIRQIAASADTRDEGYVPNKDEDERLRPVFSGKRNSASCSGPNKK